MLTTFSLKKEYNESMLVTIAIILIILWALGVVTGAVVGWFIHILLIAAVILLLIKLIGSLSGSQ
jgi:hypothetical protein